MRRLPPPAAMRAVFATLLALASATAGAQALATPPKNPFLADSAYPLGHTNSAQVDSTIVAGPLGPARKLGEKQIDYALTGPGHLGNYISSTYADGRRVIWSNGPRDIAKLDYDSFALIARFPLAGYAPFTEADAQEITGELESRGRLRRLTYGVSMIRRMLPSDLSSVYCLLDRDGNFYVGGAGGLTVYGDVRPGDADSGIAVRGRWAMPADVPGALVGMNMTYDGQLVLATDAGFVLTVSRDLKQHHALALPHREQAAAYNARMADEKRNGYNWIRNAIAVDDAGGIYVIANGWMQKVVWTGKALSALAQDGAWAEAYANGSGMGSGSTPVLMGFRADDRLVVFTDGEPLMNLTLMWRDRIPPGWKPPPGARSSRVAGLLPVTIGDPAREALQSEQAVVVAGHGMIVVNNEPASIPFYVPTRAKGLLISLLGDDPAYTPHGMEKFEWDPVQRRLRKAWTNASVSSPNCVPYVSLGSNRVYTVGVRDGEWALESIDFGSGRSAASYALGGPRYNTMFSGVYIDERGRVLFGAMFGVARLRIDSPRAAQ